MAEKDKDQASDDVLDDEVNNAKMLLGLPQPLLIKVSIGLVVILLCVGAYFLFMVEPPVDEAIEVINEDTLIAPINQQDVKAQNDSASPESLAESEDKIMALREQSMTLREENLQLRERIFQLESTLKTQQPISNTNPRPNAALINNYNDANAFPPVITDPPKPKPKPKWGEFERAK